MSKIIFFWLYCKKFYFAIYRPVMDIMDKYFSLSLYWTLEFIYILSLKGRGQIEEYIIYKEYTNLSQYERVLTDKSIVYMTMQIDYRMTWVEIHEKIKEMSNINLSKRQCYKLKEYAKANKKPA